MSLYNVNEKVVLKEIKKLQPLNYNQFRWWRRFDSPNKSLHKNTDLLRKIQNGDFDFSHFFWQAKYTELEINKIYDECYPDFTLFNEKMPYMEPEENVYGMILKKMKKINYYKFKKNSI